MKSSVVSNFALSFFFAALLCSCLTVETASEAEETTTLTETELNPAKPSENLLDRDEKVDCTSQVFSAGSKPLCK